MQGPCRSPQLGLLIRGCRSPRASITRPSSAGRGHRRTPSATMNSSRRRGVRARDDRHATQRGSAIATVAQTIDRHRTKVELDKHAKAWGEVLRADDLADPKPAAEPPEPTAGDSARGGRRVIGSGRRPSGSSWRHPRSWSRVATASLRRPPEGRGTDHAASDVTAKLEHSADATWGRRGLLANHEARHDDFVADDGRRACAAPHSGCAGGRMRRWWVRG